MGDPPVLAASPPINARNTIENPYNENSMDSTGASKVTRSGSMAPKVKDAPDANAA